MKNFLKKTLLILFLILVWPLACTIANPLRWPEEMIKSKLLDAAPLGTSISEVESLIVKKGGKILYVSENGGFLDQRVSDKNYACNTGTGTLVHRNGYYTCDKAISYEEECQLVGGKINMIKNFPKCTIEDKVVIINQKKACNLSKGNWVLTKGYDDCIVGKKNIRSDLGDYSTIFTTNVTVFWGFDEQSKLIDIWVWKTVDAL